MMRCYDQRIQTSDQETSLEVKKQQGPFIVAERSTFTSGFAT